MSNENIHEIAEQFQKECHSTVDAALSRMSHRSSLEHYQDATNVWIFYKLAEFEMRLREIENQK